MLKRIIPSELLCLLAIMWAVFIIDSVLPGITFNHFGIVPRTLEGLRGIILSPFLHGGLYHITSNTIPLLVLPFFVRLSIGSRESVFVLIAGVLGSGLGTWIFGSGGVVIGASGLVFSLIGFLLANAYFHPSLRSWAVALLSLFLYGGALLSLFAFLPSISWAAHFWGLVSGMVIALFLRSPKTQKHF